MLGIAWLGDAVSSVSSGEHRSCQQWHSLDYRVFLLGLLGGPVALLPEQTPEVSCPGGPGPLPALHCLERVRPVQCRTTSRTALVARALQL